MPPTVRARESYPSISISLTHIPVLNDVLQPNYGRVWRGFFPADKGKISLINTKAYPAVLRKFLLFFISQSFKVRCATGFMATINILVQKEVVLPTGIDSQLLSSYQNFCT